MRSRESLYWRILIGLILLNGASLLWAVYRERSLFGDGIYFYHSIFITRNFYWYEYFLRIFSASLQAPALLILKLFPDRDTNAICSALLNFTMTMHPMLSLFFCFKILKRYSSLDYFIFPVLSYALCTAALMAYTTLSVPDTLSLYWPFLLLLLFRENNTRWELPLLYFCTLGLAYCYEIAALFFLMNGFFLILKLKLLPKRSWASDFYLLMAQLVGFLFIVWRIKNINPQMHGRFSEAILFAPPTDPHRLFGIISLALLILAIFISHFKHKFLGYLRGLIFIAAMAQTIYFFYRIWEGYPDSIAGLYAIIWATRSTAPLVSAFIACVMCFLFFFYWRMPGRSGFKNFPLMLYITCLALVVSFAQDLWLTKVWHSGNLKARELAESNPGCNVISSEAERKIFGLPHFTADWFLPLQTMQIERTRKPSSVFYIENPLTGKVCYPNGNLFGNTSGIFHLPQNHYDLSALLSGPIRIHEWDEATQSIRVRLIQREPR